MRISIRSLGKICLCGFLSLILAGSVASPTHADTIDGVGELKFGMKPSEVESLEGCSSKTQCLYELLGKTGLPSPQMPEPNTPVQGTIGYHLRNGAHAVTAYDWEQYLSFADRHFKR